MAGWSIQNLTNFAASYSLPYLMNAGYGNLGSKVGFIYGSIGIAGVIWAYFFYPELKGRSLEEINEMMRLGVPARKTKGRFAPSKRSSLVLLCSLLTTSLRIGWEVPYDSIGHRLTEIEDEPNVTIDEEELEKHHVAHHEVAHHEVAHHDGKTV